MHQITGSMLGILQIHFFLSAWLGNSQSTSSRIDSQELIDGWSIGRWREVSLARKKNYETISRRGIRFRKAMEAFRVSWPEFHARHEENLSTSNSSDQQPSNQTCRKRSPPRGHPAPRFCRCPWLQIEFPGSGAYQGDNSTLLRYSSGGWSADFPHPRRAGAGAGAPAPGVTVHCEVRRPPRRRAHRGR
jgi:hypothetical protein